MFTAVRTVGPKPSVGPSLHFTSDQRMLHPLSDSSCGVSDSSCGVSDSSRLVTTGIYWAFLDDAILRMSHRLNIIIEK